MKGIKDFQTHRQVDRAGVLLWAPSPAPAAPQPGFCGPPRAEPEVLAVGSRF